MCLLIFFSTYYGNRMLVLTLRSFYFLCVMFLVQVMQKFKIIKLPLIFQKLFFYLELETKKTIFIYVSCMCSLELEFLFLSYSFQSIPRSVSNAPHPQSQFSKLTTTIKFSNHTCIFTDSFKT